MNKLLFHLRMTSSEVKRLVVRPRFLLVTVGLLVLAVTDVVLTGTRGDPPGFYGVVATTLGYDIQYPILAGIVSADALATDTEAGYTALVLGRDVRRRDYLLHKGMAIMAAAALATMVRHLWILAVAAVVLPWGAPVLPMQPPDMLLHVPGPLPALFLSNPVWNDVLSMFMTAFATGVLATLGLVVAASGGGSYMAVAAPLAFYLGLSAICAHTLPFLGPDRYLNVWWKFRANPGQEYRISIWFAYWMAIAILTTVTSVLAAEKRELGLKVRA